MNRRKMNLCRIARIIRLCVNSEKFRIKREINILNCVIYICTNVSVDVYWNIIRILYTCRLLVFSRFSFCRDLMTGYARVNRNNKAIFLLLSKTLYTKYFIFLSFLFDWATAISTLYSFVQLRKYKSMYNSIN